MLEWSTCFNAGTLAGRGHDGCAFSCKHDGADDRTATAVIRPTGHPPVGLITVPAVPSSVPPSSFQYDR